jgi:prepilin-type processing-associated H-X9-DG protein
MIRFSCECGKQLQVPDESAGGHTVCPDCGRDVRVPDVAEAVPVSPAAQETAYADYEPGGRKTSGKAIASLVLGLASFLCTIFTGIPAVILGIISLVEISRTRGRIKGQGLAIGGIVTGSLGALMIGPAILLGLLLPAVQKVREAANRAQSQNNLKQIALAMHNYNSTHGSFPPAVVCSRDGKPLYSWRVLLLPYLGNNALYKQFRLDEPWDSANNKSWLDQMPPVYRHPAEAAGDNSSTVYQAIVGKDAAFEGTQGMRLTDFTNGTANTILVAEAAVAVPWTKPDDLSYAPDRPLPRFSEHLGGGFNALFADGSVRTIQKGTKEEVLRGFLTRKGLQPGFMPRNRGNKP